MTIKLFVDNGVTGWVVHEMVKSFYHSDGYTKISFTDKDKDNIEYRERVLTIECVHKENDTMNTNIEQDLKHIQNALGAFTVLLDNSISSNTMRSALIKGVSACDSIRQELTAQAERTKQVDSDLYQIQSSLELAKTILNTSERTKRNNEILDKGLEVCERLIAEAKGVK